MTIERFENVWDAIADSPAEAEHLKLRSELMARLSKHIEKMGWTQKEAAKFFAVTQPRISDLQRGRISVFSIDMLVKMLASAGLQVRMEVISPKRISRSSRSKAVA